MSKKNFVLVLKAKKQSAWLHRKAIFSHIVRQPIVIRKDIKYSLQGTTQGKYLTGGVPPVRFSM